MRPFELRMRKEDADAMTVPEATRSPNDEPAELVTTLGELACETESPSPLSGTTFSWNVMLLPEWKTSPEYAAVIVWVPVASGVKCARHFSVLAFPLPSSLSAPCFSHFTLSKLPGPLLEKVTPPVGLPSSAVVTAAVQVAWS